MKGIEHHCFIFSLLEYLIYLFQNITRVFQGLMSAILMAEIEARVKSQDARNVVLSAAQHNTWIISFNFKTPPQFTTTIPLLIVWLAVFMLT